jgi:hypothetical protein
MLRREKSDLQKQKGKIHRMDPLPQIIEIVRDAIKDGLIPTETLERFNHQVKHLQGVALEEYLQGLWDNI